MCLYTNNGKPEISTKPIRVWKRLALFAKGGKILYKTPYQRLRVKVGETLKGLYPNKDIQSVNYTEYIIDAQGVHAYETQTEAEFCKGFDEIITEWEIPAGAKYWIGNRRSNKEIAATEMKFIKVCD